MRRKFGTMLRTLERKSRPADIVPSVLKRFAPELLYLLSGGVVLLGAYVLFRHLTLNRCTGHYFGYWLWFSNWDGQWYQYIANRGYHYSDSGGYGPQVFFPLYPLLGRTLGALSPLHGQWPLVAVSWLAALLFCRVWIRYAGLRTQGSPNGESLWGLALILFWPVAYFLRVAYTESLYILLLTLFFFGCASRWPVPALVLLTGLLTATRPTGVVVSVVLAWHVLLRFKETPWPRRSLRAVVAGALSAWGLYAYMAYLQHDFGDALLFVTKQQAWNYRMPAHAFILRWEEMLSLRPAWGFLVDGSLLNPSTYAWNLQNRGLWLLSVALVIIGVAKKWLTSEETLFCVLTMALIYYTHGPKNMESVGRYTFTIVPLFLVLTRLLVALPQPLRLLMLGSSAVLLAVQSANFRLWNCVF